jgi:hypothetical protein
VFTIAKDLNSANKKMKRPNWIKNLFFLSMMLGGVSLLAVYLMAADRIKSPSSFSPAGQRQAKVIELVGKFESQWQSENLVAAESAENLLVARRLSLGLAGTIPSLEEIREFEKQPAENQIQWWVSRLLEDKRTSNHIAERLGRALVGVEEGPFLVFRRRRFVDWLSNEILANRAYDKLVKEILTQEGLWTDTPAVNFFTRSITDRDEGMRPDPVLLASRTSRAFLGMRIDCLQCHDDFLGTVNLGSAENTTSGTQYDFHSLAAFFVEMDTSLLGIRDKQSKGPYEYKLLDADEEEVIPATVPFNADLDAREGSLRQRLARWVTHPANKPFARATVNRVWAIMVGRGLIDPVDDIPLDGPFPEALEVLADEFVESGYDLHLLIRTIAQSKVFRLASESEFEITNKHENEFAVFPMIRLRPDQVAGGIAQSTKLTTIDSNAHIITRLTKFEQQNSFIRRFGDPGEDEFQDRGETVTQRLLMLNGKMVDERLESPLNSPLHLSGLAPNPKKAVETIYLTTLSRRPTNEESSRMAAEIDSKKGSARTRAVLDLYWTLINSAEFRWNH